MTTTLDPWPLLKTTGSCWGPTADLKTPIYQAMNKKTARVLHLQPKQFDRSNGDPVNDHAFQMKDGRIPVLVATQYGIFPNKGMFNTSMGRRIQTTGSSKELRDSALALWAFSSAPVQASGSASADDLDASFMQRLRRELLSTSGFGTTRPNPPDGPCFDPSVMNQPSTYRRTASPPTSPNKTRTPTVSSIQKGNRSSTNSSA